MLQPDGVLKMFWLYIRSFTAVLPLFPFISGLILAKILLYLYHMELLLFSFVQQMCEPFIGLTPYQITLDAAKFCKVQVFCCMGASTGCQCR